MKLLLISDKESEYLWDYYKPGRLDGIDAILSCGDLSSKYLSFLVTMSGKPLLYVHGNHDKTYEQHPPEGCECAEDRIINLQGLRVLGLQVPQTQKKAHRKNTPHSIRNIRRLRISSHVICLFYHETRPASSQTLRPAGFSPS